MKNRMLICCLGFGLLTTGLFGQDTGNGTPAATTPATTSPAPAVKAAPEKVPAPAKAEATKKEVAPAPVKKAAVPAKSSTKAKGATKDQAKIKVSFPGADANSPSAKRIKDTLSVDFPDEEIRTILRNVADLFELNIVIPDTLQGRTSLKLRNVTWRQIFDVVLSPVGFTYVEDGNIIKIVSKESLTVEPPVTEVFTLNYARAGDIEPTIASMVDTSKGGRIKVDNRSNSLVITERPSQIAKIKPIIKRLDKATDQVMIETKFVEVSNQDVRDIGVNWASLDNYHVGASNLSRTYSNDVTQTRDNEVGNQHNLGTENFQNPNGSKLTGNPGDYSGKLIDNTSGTSQTILDMASHSTSDVATALTSLVNGGSIERLTTAVFNADQFGLILSALKTEGRTKLVSDPTVVTMNNTQALISIGTQFPIPNYTYNQERGTFEVSGFQYKDIGIIMKVTPHVNNNGMINLKVDPEVSSIQGETSFGGAGGASIPIISARRTSTEVILKSGYTMGLGGLMESTAQNGGTKVPLLGDIPGLGHLFRSKSHNVTKRNLLVFITAKTLSPDGSTYSDVFDPRAIRDMGLKRDEIPGYKSKIDPFAPKAPKK